MANNIDFDVFKHLGPHLKRIQMYIDPSIPLLR